MLTTGSVARWLSAAILAMAAGSVAAQTKLSYGGDLVTTKAFMADLAELYARRGSGTIDVDLLTSTDALKQAAAGEIDMGGSGRSARLEDRQERRVAVYPIVWDGLVVIVHPSNPIVNISLRQLKDVYTGTIDRWRQLGGEDRPIALYVNEDPLAAVEFNLASLLLGEGGESLARTREFATSQAVEEAVESEPAAMAMTTYSSARTLSVKILAVEGRSPGNQSLRDGEYVLFVPLYLAMREDGRNRRQVREFLRFASSTEAKRILRRNGVVPYTDGIALASKQLERAQLLEQIRQQ